MKFSQKTSVTFSLVSLIGIIFILSTIVSADQQNRVGPYEVIVYSSPDYVGDSQSFDLNIRTHRILLVNKFNNKLDNKVASIHVGSEVRAILFDHHDFHANWKTRTKRIPILLPMGIPGGTRNYFEKFRNVDVFTESKPQLYNMFIAYTSMIILPRDFKGTWGIALYNLQDKFIRIEPIPDLKKHKQRVIPDFGSYLNDKIEQVKFLGNSTEGVKIKLFDNTHFKGNSITLPGLGSDKDYFYLNNYKFNRKTKSIKVTVTDPKVNTHRAPAPPADSQIAVVKEVIPIEGVILKDFKTVKGGPVQGKQTPPPPPGDGPEVMGPWHDGHGNDYEFHQQGQAFSWFCPQRNEHGAGVYINSRRIKVIWNSPKGPGQIMGNVIKVNHEGMAEEIKFDNGVVLYRK